MCFCYVTSCATSAVPDFLFLHQVLPSCLPAFLFSYLPAFPLFLIRNKVRKQLWRCLRSWEHCANLRCFAPYVWCLLWARKGDGKAVCSASAIHASGKILGLLVVVVYLCFFNLSPRPWKDFLLTWKTERWKGYVIFISSHAATTRDHGLKSAPWNHCSLHSPLPRSLWLSVLSGTNLHSEAGARELHIFPLTSPRSFLPLDSAREAWEAHRDPCFVVRMLLGNLCAAHFLNSWHLGLTEAGSLPPESMGIFQSYTK